MLNTTRHDESGTEAARERTRLPRIALAGLLAGAALLAAPAAMAFNFDWKSDALGTVNFSWENTLTFGAQVRVEERDPDLVGKLNVPGQALLCAQLPGTGFASFFNADCMSRVGSPVPNRNLVRATGAYNINGDDGNLSYDQGDLTYAPVMLRSEFAINWKIFSAKISGIAYKDLANDDFATPKDDLRYPNRGLARRTITIDRRDEPNEAVDREWGDDMRLLATWVGANFELADTPIHIKVGAQRLRWGESNLFNFQVLDRINPLSGRLYSMPGVKVRDAFLPVGLVKFGIDFTRFLNVQMFWQYEWDPAEPVPCASFLSYNDAVACGHGLTPIYLSSGQFPEDPFRNFVPGGATVLLDQGSRTAYLDDPERGYPDDTGQYGLRVRYFFKNLNGGTQVSLYAMNIHSRLPYLSVDAAQATCLQVDGSGNKLVNNLNPCGSLENTFPVDTLKPFLDYPEDIHIYGISFTTPVGAWSLAGEVSFSPNQPAQVAYADVLYAGLQPAFPKTPEGLEPGDLVTGEQAITLPTRDVFVPDYLSDYRGNTVSPGETIRGYERLNVGQIDLTGVRVINASNWIGANRIVIVTEVAAQRVFDMPGLDELQFAGISSNVGLHYSTGAIAYDPDQYPNGDDGIPGGTPAAQKYCPNPAAGCRPIGPTDRINPEKADPDNYADDFAFGYRLRVNATYNDTALFGLTLKPGIEFFHDVYGTSITPGQNFVEGRKRLTLHMGVRLAQNVFANVAYRFYFGAGDRNVRLDRDYAQASLAFQF